MRAGDDATLPDLPTDVGALQALLLQSWCERDLLVVARDALLVERDGIAAERDALATQNERLRHLLAKLRRMRFGRTSERLPG